MKFTCSVTINQPRDKVVEYFNYVSTQLENVVLEKYGETNEHRPLYVSYISSKENIKNLEQIRQNNLGQTGLAAASNNTIAIVWLSYNVHGNESSSTEASMQTLYELVTTKKEYLENTLVIIDPCINPDGRDRYVNFYYQYGANPIDMQRFSASHNETWPGGRPKAFRVLASGYASRRGNFLPTTRGFLRGNYQELSFSGSPIFISRKTIARRLGGASITKAGSRGIWPQF